MNEGIDQSEKVAVFWDYENARVWAEGIQIPLAERVLNLVERYGQARILKVYSKWGGSEAISRGLFSMGFRQEHVPMGKKNSVDVMIAVDCIATCWEHPEIGVYVIVSGDKDYISMVNYLKAHGRHVVIVGPSETSSEHLQLSASEFFSFEDLAEDDVLPATDSELKTGIISYEDALQCLGEAIESAKDQGKVTRYPIIDSMMRLNKEFEYRGYASIVRSDGSRFSSFGGFIKEAERDGACVTFSTGEFAEIFLPGENPKEESSYTTSTDNIEPKHWELVLERIEAAFSEGNPSHYLYGRFYMLYLYMRSLKKDGIFKATNSTFERMLEKIIEDGLLTKQANESYRLAENYEEKKKEFLKSVAQELGTSS
ncbi:MAG: NYN domain-containing protein [Candidatus Thorarchaeota archaeon]